MADRQVRSVLADRAHGTARHAEQRGYAPPRNAFTAMLGMTKLDIAALQRAYENA